MGVCKICGSRDASYICRRCGGMVCSQCFHPERHLCSVCKDLRERERLVHTKDLRSIFGKLLPAGFALVSGGIFLMVVASVLSLQAGEGAIFIFPLFIGTTSGSLAVLLTIAAVVITLVLMFLPWIIGPRKIMRVFRRIGGVNGMEATATVKTRSGRGLEDYLITLEMPGFEEDDIDIQVFDGDLVVQAHRDGRVFERMYELPRGFHPTGLEYKCEDDFLIIRVSLKLRENA